MIRRIGQVVSESARGLAIAVLLVLSAPLQCPESAFATERGMSSVPRTQVQPPVAHPAHRRPGSGDARQGGRTGR